MGSTANSSNDVTCPYCATEWELEDDEAQQDEFLCTECNHSFPIVIRFNCIVCNRALRLRGIEASPTYKCPGCQTRYKTISAQANRPVFVLIPTNQASSSQNRRAVSTAMKAALAVLGCDELSTFESVKQAYRTMMKDYHPDRVSHLGLELRALAEKKSKEINAAYEALSKHFSA